MADRERRVVDLPVEGRSGDGAPPRLSGYAALYGVETVIGGMFREMLEPGAFTRALSRGDDVRALFNHDPNFILGRTTSGTLRLSEDDKGLRYDIDLPETQFGKDLWTLVQRGDVSQSSFAFRVDAEEWRDLRAELPLRVVKDVQLFDVSAVTYPAYPETSVAARSQAESFKAEAAGAWRAQLATARAQLATVDVCGRHRR